MKKRIISSIMCLAMLLSLLPVSAFASNTESKEASATVGTSSSVSTAADANGIHTATLTGSLTLVKSGTDNVGGSTTNTWGYWASITMPVATDGSYYILSRSFGVAEKEDSALAKIITDNKSAVDTNGKVNVGSTLAQWYEIRTKASFEDNETPYWVEIERDPNVQVVVATPKASGEGYDFEKYKFDFSEVTLEPMDSTIVAAPVVDVLDSGKADKYMNVTAGTPNVADGVTTVALSGTVKPHWNSEKNTGYWVGIGVTAPTGATQVKYAFKTEADKANLDTLSSLTPLEKNVDGKGHDGIAFYADATNKDAAKIWARVQWFDADGDRINMKPVTYKMDLTGVTCDKINLNAVHFKPDVASSNAGAGISDALRDTMWAELDARAVEGYYMEVTDGTTTWPMFALEESDFDEDGTGRSTKFAWSFHNSAQMPGAVMKAGTYTVKLYTYTGTVDPTDMSVSGTKTPVNEKTVTLGKITVQKAVTANAGDDKVGYYEVGDNVVTIGQMIETFPTPVADEGTSFLGWVKSTTPNAEPISTDALKALKPTNGDIYVPKMAESVTVTFNVNGGTGDVPGPIKVEKAKGFTVENIAAIGDATLTRTNYIFDGWATRSGDGEPYTYTKVDLATKTFDADTILYAQWKAAGVTSATLKNDGNSEVISGTTVTATAPVAPATKGILAISGSIPAPAAEGTAYKVSYILEGKESAETPIAVTIKADGDSLTADPEEVTLGAVTYTVDLTDLSALVAGVEIGNSGETDVATPNTSDTEKFAFGDSGVTGDSLKTSVANTTATFEGTADADSSLAAKLAETAGAVTEQKVDELYAEAKTVDGNESKTFDKIEVVPSLKIDIEGYNAEESTLTLNIVPQITYVAVNAANPTDKVTVGTPVTLSETERQNVGPVVISFAKPAFVAAGNPDLYVLHKGNVYTAIWDAGSSVYTFTNPNGFSEFVITANNPIAASVTVGGNTSDFETLAAAIAFVPARETITLAASYTAAKQGDISGINKNFSIDATSVSPALNDAAKTALKTAVEGAAASGYTVTATWSGDTLTVTATANTTPPPIGPTGGGSVSNKVNIGSTTNGKITANNYNPKEGDTVTITATPNDGYVTGTVTVKDAKGNDVTVTKTGDNTFTFTMPKDKVTVNATFVKEDTSTFTDVNDGDYYADAVKWAVEKGITNGLTATTFGPNNSCTRGQMVTFLWRAAGSPAATGTNSFSDVASGEYYYNAVLWAVEKGITNGTSATTFSPNATVNRGQTVTFLYRYAESPAATGDTSFTDVTSDAFYADAVKWAVAEEITNGTSSTTFSPASDCTRGQIVTFMYRQMAE